MDDATRLLADPVFFADGFLGVFAAAFARVFEAAFFAGAAGVAGSAGGGASVDLGADEVADFLAAVFAGAGALTASEDFLAGAFLPAAFLAAGAGEAGAGAASGFTVAADDDAFVREPIFSANDFLGAAAPRDAAADLAFGDPWAAFDGAELADAAASG